MSLHVKVAGAWQEIGEGGGSSMKWAKVSGGTVTEVTNADGSVDEVHTFTTTADLLVEQEGVARVLVVGGAGGGGNNEGGGGGGGGVQDVFVRLTAGTFTAHVGTGGIGGVSGQVAPSGTQSWLAGSGYTGTGSDYTQGVVWGHLGRGGGQNANVQGAGGGFVSDGGVRQNNYSPGRVSDITGTAVEYGCSGGCGIGSNNGTTMATPGSGGYGGKASTQGGPGQNGIVIVRVQKSKPTVSGVVASGGTVTEYVGDGVNGVLGQKYRVHVFDADSSLVVTQGGEADVLVCAGGGGGTSGWGGGGGGGGGVTLGRVVLSPGTHPVVVGAGGGDGSAGNSGVGYASRFGLVTAGGGGGTGGSAGSTEGRSGTGYLGNGTGGSARGGGAAGPATASAPGPGVVSSISGSSVEYGKGGTASGGANPLPGQGGNNNQAGRAGRVVVRYEIEG